MINEPVKPPTMLSLLGNAMASVCTHVVRGRPNTTVMVVNVTMKRERSFICPQDVKNPCGILFHFREGPLRKCFPVRYLLAKVHGTIAICMGTAGGFDEEYCGQMMVLNIEEYPPESHIKNYTSLHYKDMVEDVGFTVVYCKQVQNVTTFPSDEIYANFLYSLCELSPFIANDEKNQFKNDLLRYTLKQNGRNTDGTPVDRSTTLELVIRKTH
ncbi:uncharacterized protein TNCV_3484381 [Trichonephila clavipes]|nr:uncharacterized protein TNCV_3484381 [Trichonephila clavipes]